MPQVRALLTMEEAQARILERVRPLPSERVPLAAANGRVLAEDARAAVDLPPFASSAMDGFAVRAADVPGRLALVSEAAAGRPAGLEVRPGETIAISTGSLVPAGADAVVPVEYVVHHDTEIEIPAGIDVGAHVRAAGGDARAGDVVAPAGTQLAPHHLGALAAAGVAEATCARRPRAAVVATGNELRPPGARLGPGEIYEANTVLLAAALEGAGAVVTTSAGVADDRAAHRDALARALVADLVVTTGGVSVGEHDLVRSIAAELGVEEVFWGVSVKPGKPLSFGVRGDTLVFGLPGNPVSTLVTFELFVRPAVLALQGAAEPVRPFLPGRLAAATRRNAERDELVRARVAVTADAVVLTPLRGQESHMIGRSAAAGALVFVPRGAGEVPAGETVGYLPLAGA